MQTFDASNPNHMAEVTRRRMENSQNSAASMKGVNDAKARRAAINAKFAELFAGDENATAAAVAETLNVAVADVENAEAFIDAYNGETAAELRKVYGL